MTGTPPSKLKRTRYHRLLKAIELANGRLVNRAAVMVNQALVVRNWLIGAHIVEFEQEGLDRAKYGDRFLDRPCSFWAYPEFRGALTPKLAALFPGQATPVFHTPLTGEFCP